MFVFNFRYLYDNQLCDMLPTSKPATGGLQLQGNNFLCPNPDWCDSANCGTCASGDEGCCDSTFYENEGCSPCHSNCETCSITSTNCLSCSTFPFCFASEDEIQSLVDLYDATNGDSWNVNTNWNVGDPCINNWFGITCDDSDTTILEIKLGNNNLAGSLPDLILPNLTRLFVFLSFCSTIILIVWFCFFSGNFTTTTWMDQFQIGQTCRILPSCLYSFRVIYLLCTHNNCFCIYSRYLYGNELSGPIPNWGNMPNLLTMLVFIIFIIVFLLISFLIFRHLFGNKLNGTIPNWTNLPKLSRMFVFASCYLSSVYSK